MLFRKTRNTKYEKNTKSRSKNTKEINYKDINNTNKMKMAYHNNSNFLT